MLCVDGSLNGVQRFDLRGRAKGNSAASVQCASNAGQTEVAAIPNSVCYTGAANGQSCSGSSTTCGDLHRSRGNTEFCVLHWGSKWPIMFWKLDNLRRST